MIKQTLAQIFPILLLSSCSGKETFATDARSSASSELIENAGVASPGESSAGTQADNQQGEDLAAPAADGAEKVDARLGTTGTFLEPGKSLDLYLLIDRSGSMSDRVLKGKVHPGSDSSCKRLAALGGLLDGISPLVPELRLNIILFANESKHLVTLDTKEQEKPVSFKDWVETFRDRICDAEGATNILSATKSANKLLQDHDTKGTRKEVTSLVLFTDGMPTLRQENQQTEVDVIVVNGTPVTGGGWPTAKEMDAGIAELHAKFGAPRIFGLLLGQNVDQLAKNCFNVVGDVTSPTDCPAQTPLQFMHKYTASPERTLLAKDADSLAAKMTELIKK